MGKKAKKAAANCAASKAKSDCQGDGHRSKTEAPRAKECAGSKLPEQHRHSKVDSGSEFYRVASIFGIHGDNPSQFDFVHPEYSWPHRKDPAESNNPMYNAMWEAVIDEYENYDKWRRAYKAGRAPWMMTWQQACNNMRHTALARLRHKRKQRKFRDKKMSNASHTVPVL